ncbi:HAD-IA family hydrolase [Yersinia mollaretii]|nr:HAD-IA family hydrolase [Yersinia mollaretii]NIL01468.1 HAD-IA family hydrolase [Yersinia mollaretii]
MKFIPVITSDFLMTSGDEQDNNVKWLSDFIKRPLNLATKTNPICFSSKEHQGYGFFRDDFFKRSNILCDESQKQFFFEIEDITNNSIEYLSSCFPKNTIFISYELSEQTRNILDCAGLIYIDIWLHPIRYMDDVLFGLRSNNEKINESLKQFNIPSETYFLYSDRLKVQNYRGHRRSNIILKNNSALFVGQTLNDKAIFHDNKMLTLLDFKCEFEAIVKKYSHIYYSRHPFVKEGDEEILNYLKRFKNVSINNDPAYHLLASNEIKYVFSISSSVAHEAKYFGKETDFLFKPVIKIGDDGNIYYSVMHEIFYGSFWSKVLSPIMETVELKNISYFSGKDKTRDALSFYWGYRNIDKIENVKQTLSVLWARSNTISKDKKKLQNSIETTDVFDSIDKYEIISFDIFDTLITRLTFSPREIFNIIEQKFNATSPIKLSEFRQLRTLAEDKALEEKLKFGLQECSFDDIYSKLQELLHLDNEVILKLKKIEIDTELEYSKRRSRGVDLFEYAKQKNKRIILISDMYLNSTHIKMLLDKNGISGFDKLYISSEIGLKKKSGDLFKHVLVEECIKENDMFHIGDNIDGDKKAPEALGISSYRVPRAVDIAKFRHPHLKRWIDNIAVNKTNMLDMIATLTTDKFYDNELSSERSLYNGDKFRFGYQAFGPIIIGFTMWIRNEAINKGLEKLFFLSRDTKVVYDCYNILFPNDSIKTCYLYSSRRSVKVPQLKTSADLYPPIYKKIYSSTISEWLKNNYGLSKEDYDESILINNGLTGYDQAIGGKFSKDILSKIILELDAVILSIASQERKDITAYLTSMGMNTEKDVAIVDIGYAATMQAAYMDLLDKSNIHGLYYATFNTALKNVPNINLTSAYSLTLGSPSAPNHGICTHRFFYESIFCDADYSLIKLATTENGFNFIKTDFADEKRQQVVRAIHSGVLSLARDIKEYSPSDYYSSYVDPRLSALLLDSFLSQPDENDARMFMGVLFEDSSIPNAVRYLYIPDELRNDPKIIENIIWKEPVALFIKKTSNPDKNAISPPKLGSTPIQSKSIVFTKISNLMTIERKILNLALNDRKFKKYERNRESFFIDSKSKFISIYYRSIGKKLGDDSNSQ